MNGVAKAVVREWLSARCALVDAGGSVQGAVGLDWRDAMINVRDFHCR